MAKMTKSQVMTALSEKSGLAKKQVVSFMDILSAMAYKEVKTGGEFVLPGFGKLVKIQRKARLGRNPLTGAEIQIPAKTVVKFKVAKAVKDSVL
jgi:DNA-binding protein HU-beta